MKGDFTRSTFRAGNRYSQVRAQQGRGILDAELNEQADIAAHFERTTNLDVIGASGVPVHPQGTFRNFQIAVNGSRQDLRIAPGRMYVDGILCENDAVDLEFTLQPDLPQAALPDAAGEYAAYLDVWERHIGASEEPAGTFPPMREAALGGADTASRVRVIWQVKLARVDAKACGAFTPPAPPTGRLRAAETAAAQTDDDCLVPDGGGYRRLENQLYRVEVHEVASGKTTYKWSRDNASMASKVKSSDAGAAILVVEDAGRDDVVGFAGAKYVELSDEVRTLHGQGGALFEVETVTGTSVKVKNPDNLSLALGPNAILRRWDGVGELQPNAPVELEDGVQVEFDGGSFEIGDHWLIPARTSTGKVEWPRDGVGDGIFEPRHGTIHHYAALAVVSFDGSRFDTDVLDCRKPFPPLTALPAGGDEPGIHVKGAFFESGDELRNDALVVPGALAKGLRIVCDERLFEGSVRNEHGLPNPVCTLTAEVPWPLRGEERQFWGVGGGEIVGFQPVTLAGEVVARENTVAWRPLGPTQTWLEDRLLQMFEEMTGQHDPRVLVRLRLAGNFVWGPERDPRLYVDGDPFGIPGDGRIDLRFPSGDGRRGGDFQMWFWLARAKRRAPGVGFIPGLRSKFFLGSAGDIAFGKQAIQLGLERSAPQLRELLPEDYEVDAAQAFDPAAAAKLAKRTGVGGITGLVSAPLEKLGRFLVERLQDTLRIELRTEAVPDAKLLELVRAGMATGAPPDFVIGDESLARRLQELGYADDFLRL